MQVLFLTSVRIGNELGASHPRVARFAVIVVVTTSIIISTIISVLVLILKTPLSKLYTSSTIVIAAVANLTPLLSISILLNGVQPILSGMLHFPFFLIKYIFYTYFQKRNDKFYSSSGWRQQLIISFLNSLRLELFGH
jgi:MatE